MSCCGTKPTLGRELVEEGNVTRPVVWPDLALPARISIRVVFPAPIQTIA